MRRARAYLRATLLLGVVASVGTSCGSSGAGSPACIPGASLACACPSGDTGAQICSADGKSLGPCVCSGGAGTGGGGGAGGSGGGGNPGSGGVAGTAGSTGGTVIGGRGGSGGTAGSTGGAGAGGRGGSGGTGGTGGGGGTFACIPGSLGGGAGTPDGGAGTPDGGAITCPSPFALADFDGDGVTDCLLTTPSTASGCPGQSILFHKGLGGNTYAAAEVVTPYAVPIGATAAGIDLSGDGCADLYLSLYDSTYQTSSHVYVRALCDGTFGPIPFPRGLYFGAPEQYVGGSGVLGDINGDGRTDLSGMAHTIHDGTQSIYWITRMDTAPSSGPGNLTGFITNTGLGLGANGQSGFGGGVADFNNDGKKDVWAEIHYRGLNPVNAYSEVIIGLGDGQGAFTRTIEVTATRTTSGYFFDGVSVDDSNGDGKLDLSVTWQGAGTQIFYGDGTGNFSTTPP